MTINLNSTDHFVDRHIGPSDAEVKEMLEVLNADSVETLISETIPADIRRTDHMNLPEAKSEHGYLNFILNYANENQKFHNFLGLGYYGTRVPAVIQRNILENPGWYTQYTPYQAEIAQGRLEALLNFQTMVSDLTGMELANASLLDEGTAAAEAMIMLYNHRNKRVKGDPINRFLVSDNIFPQTLEVLKTRALPLGIEIVTGSIQSFNFDNAFAAILQYPGADGRVEDYSGFISEAQAAGTHIIFAADLLSLTLLKSPGEMGADIVVGNTQRFGVPMFYGGPHAAYFATKGEFKRNIPGRIIGVSKDKHGNQAYRMALQTREQHIKREKATSNICTAQALLAIMAGMYGVWHGPEGLKNIATRIHTLTCLLNEGLQELEFSQTNPYFFDTLEVSLGAIPEKVFRIVAETNQVNFHYPGQGKVRISLDETHTAKDLDLILSIFAWAKYHDWPKKFAGVSEVAVLNQIPGSLRRQSTFMDHPIFHQFRSETEMMRYIKRLENRDLSLTHSMIALGSCTMKLNAAAELKAVSFSGFANLHPFCPSEQAKGYWRMISELETYLNEVTGFAATSLQPNSGAQGEYTGLMVIRAFHHDHGDQHRNVIIVPSSAHGTNPASAVMAGMKVVVTKTDEMGNINPEDLRRDAEKYKDNLAGLMITYPSTHGVFEAQIREVCEIIHENGGLVYMDGANMNAQVGLTSPALIGADVCHLNLHKTFAIPHGGGGPGMGPICVNEKLLPYLPGHIYAETGGEKAIHAVSAAPWGSAAILQISYAYIRMLGANGMIDSTKMAILNANYLKNKLEPYYPVLYTGENGRVAHEFILDFRGFKQSVGIDVEDVAKRLMDYGFHAPTVSFPVPGTMMIEPTESESKAELDRFVEAMLGIRNEIAELEEGTADQENNVLKNAPHTLAIVTGTEWNYPYTRQKAAMPASYLQEGKFWPYVGRIDNSYGDRHLICTCPPIEMYADPEPVA